MSAGSMNRRAVGNLRSRTSRDLLERICGSRRGGGQRDFTAPSRLKTSRLCIKKKKKGKVTTSFIQNMGCAIFFCFVIKIAEDR